MESADDEYENLFIGKPHTNIHSSFRDYNKVTSEVHVFSETTSSEQEKIGNIFI
jgi:hypothetical protein